MTTTITGTTEREIRDAEFLHHLFVQNVKDEMKGQLMELAESIVDEACEKAISSMKAQIETLYSQHNNERLVRLIIERKDKK